MANTLHHWKTGAPYEGASGRFGDVTNPATGEVSARVAFAGEEDVQAVVASAAAAFPQWRDTSLAKRTQVLFAFRELLNAREHELAAIITAEHGKVLSDALGEVTRGQEVVEFACGVFEVRSGEVFGSFASGQFINQGTIRKTTANTAIIRLPVTNQAGGVIEVQQGTLQLFGSSGNTYAGVFDIAAGSTLSLSGTSTILAGATSVGAGELFLPGTFLTINGASPPATSASRAGRPRSTPR